MLVDEMPSFGPLEDLFADKTRMSPGIVPNGNVVGKLCELVQVLLGQVHNHVLPVVEDVPVGTGADKALVTAGSCCPAAAGPLGHETLHL